MSPLAFSSGRCRWLRGHLALSRHAHRRAELRLRPVRPPRSRRSSGRELDLCAGESRCNGAEPVRADDARALRRGASRRAASSRQALVPVLRPGRGDAVRGQRRATARPVVRLRADRGALPPIEVVDRPRTAAGRRVVGCGRPSRTTSRSSSSTRRRCRAAPPARSARSGCRGAERRAAATGTARRRPSGRFGARLADEPARGRSCAPATSASCRTASCSSPAGSRT